MKVNTRSSKILSLVLLLVVSLLLLFCAHSDNFILLNEVTGPIKTNCHLLYDVKSKEAAIIDVGGPIDSLSSHIDENNLILKYIFATHGHMDHLEGVAQILEKYPKARLCMSKDDYEDFLIHIEWTEKNWESEELAEMKQHPEIGKWFEYDLIRFIEPDIYVIKNEIYKLGNLEIKIFLSPGHSAGSICYHVGDVLFSGDVLFYRQVGRTDLLNGSREAIVKSVRRLYAELPDETKVYPGHGQFTDIGTEKTENEEVTINEAKLKK